MVDRHTMACDRSLILDGTKEFKSLMERRMRFGVARQGNFMIYMDVCKQVSSLGKAPKEK